MQKDCLEHFCHAGVAMTFLLSKPPPGLVARLQTPFAAEPHLLHRYRFGEIPRLIHIRPLQHRNVIGKKLQWNSKDDR